MRLREFLTETKWCQGWYAMDARGNECLTSSSDATKWCLLGAMQVVYPDWRERLSVQDRYSSLIRILHGQRIKDFNDSADWEDVNHILQTIDA